MSTQSKHAPAHMPGVPRTDHADEIAEVAHEEFEIRKLAQSSIFMCVLSLVLTPFIGGPGAIYMARRALAKIAETGLGQKYTTMAQVGKMIGIGITVLSYGIALVCLAVLLGIVIIGSMQSG